MSVSIGNDLKDAYKPTNKWVGNNIKWLGDIEQFYRERANLEKDYANKLQQLSAEYFKKKAATTVQLSVGDTPAVTPGSLESASLVAWTKILSQTENIAQDHMTLSRNQNKLADAVQQLQTKSDHLLKQADSFQNELTKMRDEAYDAHKKAKAAYDDAAQSMENTRAKSGSGEKHQRKVAEKELLMNIAKNKYLIKINIANRMKDKYYFQDVPEALDILQDINESRVLALNRIWLTASNMERQHADLVKQRVDKQDDVIKQNTSHLDTAMFIKHNATRWNEPTDFKYTPSPVWHDDEKFIINHEELNELKKQLAQAQRIYDDLDSKVNGDKEKLHSLQETKTKQEVESYQETVRQYLMTLSVFTKHETQKLQAEVEIESILNNTAGQDLTYIAPEKKEKKGLFGIFKKSSIKRASTQQSDATSMSDSVSMRTRSDSINPRARTDSIASRLSNTNLNRVLYDYAAADFDEISIHVGDSITVIAADNGGWTRVSNATTGQTGLVPSSYIDVHEKPAPPPSRKAAKKVKALYDYTATGSDEIDIRAGDEITLLKDDNNGWTYGELGGRTGLFPTSYVAPI